MKKIIYIFFILAINLNFISCGNKDNNNETIAMDGQANKQKEITNTNKVKSEELKVDTFTTNDEYVKANRYMVH